MTDRTAKQAKAQGADEKIDLELGWKSSYTIPGLSTQSTNKNGLTSAT